MCDVRYALRWESHEEEGKRREEAAEQGQERQIEAVEEGHERGADEERLQRKTTELSPEAKTDTRRQGCS